MILPVKGIDVNIWRDRAAIVLKFSVERAPQNVAPKALNFRSLSLDSRL